MQLDKFTAQLGHNCLSLL